MKLNRREYLFAGAVSAVAGLFTKRSAWAEAPTEKQGTPDVPTGIIDWHTHWFSPTELALLKKRTIPPRLIEENGERYVLGADTATGPGSKFHIEPRHVDLPGRIPYLDKTGVERQVVSYTVAQGYDATIPIDELKPILRGFNDDLAEVTRQHSQRFSGLAALSTADPTWSSAELERTHKDYGFLGGALPLNAFASLEGAKKLAPIFETAQRLKSHLLIHRGAASASIPGQPVFQIAADSSFARTSLLTDTQLAAGAITLGLTDFLDAYPDVSVQVIMLGGAIPYVVEQIQVGPMRINHPSAEAAHDPIKRFRRIYFDPGPYSVCRRAVELTVEVFGADRLLFGSDYGPMPALEPAIATINGLSRLTGEDKSRIFRENGKALLLRKGIGAA
jgi:predicted TIM-barrel fold metal-dependent hydrolase